MKLIGLFSAAILLSVSALHGASVTTSVTCSRPDSGTVTSSNSCSLGSSGVDVTSASINLQFSPGNTNLLSLSSAAQTGILSTGPLAGTAAGSASAIGSLNATVVTAGPVRPGFLVAQFGFNSDAYVPSDVSFTLSLSGSSIPAGLISQNLEGNASAFARFGSPIPVTLGLPVTLASTSRITVSPLGTGISAVPTYGQISNTSFSFQFLESDGRTVAAASETPEPATIGITGIGVVMAMLAARRLRPSR